MAPQWMPQNIQKRLLKYVLQQLSLFSEIDLPNLDVSLGTNSRITLTNLELDIERFDIPGIYVRSGSVKEMELVLTIGDGLNINCKGLEMTVTPSATTTKHNGDREFSLAKSTVDLATSVMFDDNLEDTTDDLTSNGEKESQSQNRDNNNSTDNDSTQQKDNQYALSGMMSKAVDMALSRLKVDISDISLIILSDPSVIEVHLEQAQFISVDGVRNVTLEGLAVKSLKPDIYPGKGLDESSDNEKQNDESESDRSNNSDSDDDYDYNDKLMSTSFMATDKNDVTQSLVDSILFANDDAASSMYMSTTSKFFDANSSFSSKTIIGSSKSKSDTILMFVDEIKTSFEGLQSVEDLKVKIGEIKISASPLPACISSLLDSIQHISKLSAMKKASTEIDEKISTTPNEKSSSPLLESLGINQILISLTSAITSSGSFAQKDDIRLKASDINIQQRSSSFILGGIEKLSIVKSAANIFRFEESRLPNPDLKFEILKSSVVRTTLLCSKTATMDINSDILNELIAFCSKLSPLLDSIGEFTTSSSSAAGPSLSSSYYQSSKLSRKPSSPLHLREALMNPSSTAKEEPEISEFSAQASSIYINFHLSDIDRIVTTILPPSFNSLTGIFETNRIMSEYINDSLQDPRQLFILNQLSVNTHKTPTTIRTFDLNTQHEINYTTERTTSIDNIYIDIDFKMILQLSDLFTSFSNQLEFPNHSNAHPTNSSRKAKKVRLGSSFFFGTAKVLQNYVTLNHFGLKITAINELFGDLEANLSNFSLACHKDKSLTFCLKDIYIGRRLGYEIEPLLSVINKDDKDQPPLVGKFKDSLSLHFRNVCIDYYGKWLAMFDTNGKTQEELNEIHESQIVTKSRSKFTVKIGFSDFIIGLSPVNLVSKAMLVVKKGHGEITLNSDGTTSIKSSFSTISVQLIDDISNILSDEQSNRFRRLTPSWTLVSMLKNKGYVSVGYANSFFLLGQINTFQKLKFQKDDLKPLIDIKVNLNDLKVELCADSCNCMLQLFKDLKQPIQFTFDEKYKPSTEVVNVFDTIDDNFYNPKKSKNVDRSSTLVTDNEIDSSSIHEELSIVDDFYAMNVQSDSEIPSLGQNSVGGLGNSEEVIIDEDHFNSNDTKETLIIPMAFSVGVQKVTIKLFDGYDWKETQTQMIQAIQRVESKARETSKVQSKKNNSPSVSSSKKTSTNSSRESSIVPESNSIASDNFDEDVDGNNEVVGEMLYESIHVSFPAKKDPSQFYDRINQSLNFNTGETGSEFNSSNSSLQSSAETLNYQRNGSKQQQSSHNIDLGTKMLKKRLRLRRSKMHKILIELEDVDFIMQILNSDEPHPKTIPAVFSEDENADDSELVNIMDITVRNLQIIDNVPTSSWNMFLGYLREAGEREVNSKMLNLNIKTVRPVAKMAASELVLSVSVLPVRLYVDQDTLDFLTRFGEFKDSRFTPPLLEGDDDAFIERIKVDAVKMKLDYKPKKVDYAGIRSGHTNEFMNFFILDESEMILQNVLLYGVAGFDRLHKLLNDLWMPDIKRNQLGGVLAGLAPVKSIVKIGSGFGHLLTVPIKEYQKDGRLMRSLQKGATSFSKTTGGELLKLGVKLVAGTQTILESTEEALGGEGSNARLPYNNKNNGNRSRRGSGSSRRSSASKQREYIYNGGGGPGDERSLIGRSSLNNYKRRMSFDAFAEDDVDDLNDYGGQNIYDQSRGLSAIESDSDDVIEEDIYEEEDEFEDGEQKLVSLYSNQPQNLNEGLKTAYESFGRNISNAREAILVAGSKASESGSAQIAAKEIAKVTPVMIIRPIIGTTEAISKTLLGGINTLDPEERRKAEEKYKRLD